MTEISHSFRAMNTDVETIVVAEMTPRRDVETALDDVEKLFRLAEATLSRFRLDSELSELNASAGRPFRASPLLFSVVSAAIAAARLTRGLFDPTVLRMLTAAGYDRSFELLPPDRAGVPSPPGPATDWRDVELHQAGRTILLPPRCGLDLGGIGKGWTLDRAAASLARFQNFAIDAGGDIALGGRQADGSLWTIGIEHPLGVEQDVMELQLTDRAIATSTTAHRRWRAGGREQHHLIDPRSGQPARSGAIAATVVAATVAAAETWAKAALILGPTAGVHLLDSVPDAAGIVVLEGGCVERTARFERLQRVA